MICKQINKKSQFTDGVQNQKGTLAGNVKTQIHIKGSYSMQDEK